VSAAADNDNGRVEVVIEASESEKVLANIIIRRASSRSNFTVWEDVHAESLSLESGEKYSWYDFTVESGVFYQYGVQ
jgi:hypothetical protein